MKKLLVILMVFCSSAIAAQETHVPTPSLLALDTTLDVAGNFNSLVMKWAPGFRLFGTDKQQRGNLVYTYVDGREGTMQISYKYQVADGKPVVYYQYIKADLAVIMAVVNGLFGSNLPADVDHTTEVNGEIRYRGKTYQCSLQADDLREGYWILSFVK